MASPVGLKSPKTAAPAAQKSGLHAMLETRAEPPVKYTLSVTGVTGDDESIFEKAWDAQRFRHEAAEVLQQCGPRVGDKNEGVDQWVNVAATKVEVAFRSQVKSILKAGRTANESERSMLNAWLSERDFSVNKLTAERDQAVRDADEARKAMQAQAELLGRSATEALEKSESNQRLMDDLARAKHDNEDLARRERQLLDSLAQCRLQMEEKEAKYTEMSEYVENALKERTETSLQFEKLREDIQHQTSTFTSWQQHTHDEHTEEVRGLQAEIVNLQNQVLELNEQMMQKEVVLSTAESSKAKLEAAAAVALSQAKNEWNQVEIDLRARLDKLKNVENENRVLQEYASTLLKAYQSHGLQVSRNRPHHEGVTRTWGDIYRYVASTAWGQAAGLKDLGKKMRFPIYQKPEHAFPTRPFSRSRNSDRYFGDDDNTANTEGGADGDKTTQETIRRAATGNVIENSSYRRFNLGKNNSVVSLELSTNVSMPGSPPNPSAENSTRPGDAGAGVTAVQFQEHSNGSREVLSRMRDVWGSMHDRFTQFNGRPNTKGGFDWTFNSEDWMHAVRALNLGVSDDEIRLTFDELDKNGSGWLMFHELQDALRQLSDTHSGLPRPSSGTQKTENEESSRGHTSSIHPVTNDGSTFSPSREGRHDSKQQPDAKLFLSASTSPTSIGLTTMSSMSTPQSLRHSPGPPTPSKRLAHAIHVLQAESPPKR